MLYLQALGPTIVAALVGAVAFRQWLTARAKLKLDLFDKRFAVYKTISDAVFQSHWTGPAAEESSKRINEMRQQAQFLFDAEVNQIVAEMDQLAFEMRNAVRLRDDPAFSPGNEQIVREELQKVMNHPGDMIVLIEKLRRAVQPSMSMF